MQPTPQDIERITERIEILESARFWPEGGLMRLSESGATWGELTGEQQISVLTSSVNWVGFDAGQIVDVTRRVVAGEAMEFWMNGVTEGSPLDPDYERWRDELPSPEGEKELFVEWREDAALRGFGRKEYIPSALSDRDAMALEAELQKIKDDTYIDAEEQATGSMYQRGDGYPFHELPVVERESLIEDYVDWGKYMERGLTFEDQGRVMDGAARDTPRDDFNRALDAAADRGKLQTEKGRDR
jgi:hypothetical protein